MKFFHHLLLLVSAFAFVAGVTRADDLVLADGRYLQVRFLKGDERGVHVRLLDTGGEILIPWELIREADRDRLMKHFGLKEDEEDIPLEKGVKLVAKSGDVFLGVPETPIPEGQIPPEVILWIEGRRVPFKAENIRSLETTMVPSREAFTREQLYERYINQFPLEEDDLEGHWDAARYCASIGYYEKAVQHFLRVQELDPGFRSDYVTNQIERLEDLARNEKILDQLRRAMTKGYYNQFDSALEIVDKLLQIKDMDPNVQLQIELKQQKLQAMRWKHYARLVVRNYHRLLDLKLRKMAADSKLKLNQAKRELRREVHKEIIADLAQRYGLDQKTEVTKMWEERKVHGYRTASYGSGTFIVLGKAKGADKRNQQVEAAIRRALGQRRGRGGSQSSSFNNTFQRLPKPPTPDEWWKKAGSAARWSWMKAYYAENSGQMKDVTERWEGCSRCGATGTIGFSGAQGEILKVTCPRCAGHKRDKRVAYK